LSVFLLIVCRTRGGSIKTNVKLQSAPHIPLDQKDNPSPRENYDISFFT